MEIENIILRHAHGDTEEVVIPFASPDEKYHLVGRSRKTEHDRENQWWERNSPDSNLFIYSGSGSRSNPPGGHKYHQLDDLRD